MERLPATTERRHVEPLERTESRPPRFELEACVVEGSGHGFAVAILGVDDDRAPPFGEMPRELAAETAVSSSGPAPNAASYGVPGVDG